MSTLYSTVSFNKQIFPMKEIIEPIEENKFAQYRQKQNYSLNYITKVCNIKTKHLVLKMQKNFIR